MAISESVSIRLNGVSGRRVNLLGVALAVALGLTLVSFTWVGFQGGDDHSYADAALAWAEHGWHIGTTHWALRYPVVLSIAASFRLFGVHEMSLALPFVLSYLALLAGTFWFVQRFFDSRFASAVIVAVATVPALAVAATFAEVDIMETFFVSLSLGLFCIGINSGRPAGFLAVAGVAAGLAWLTRETTAALILLYGGLFLIGFGTRRGHCLWMAAGFAAVLGMELVFHLWLTGDPLYRYRISASHDVIDRSFSLLRSVAPDAAVDTEGNLLLNNYLDPVLTLFTKHQFGIIFYLFIPACVWLCRAPSIDPAGRRVLRIIAASAVVWTLFVIFNPMLYIVARYFTFAVFAATIVVVAWLFYGVFPARWWLAWMLGGGVIAANLLGIHLENKVPLYAERHLLEYLVQRPHEAVYSDPSTKRRVDLLTRFAEAKVSISADPVPPGGLYFYNVKNVEKCQQTRCGWSHEHYRPGPDWIKVDEIPPERRLIGRLMLATGIASHMPNGVFQKFYSPNPGGPFLRVPTSTVR